MSRLHLLRIDRCLGFGEEPVKLAASEAAVRPVPASSRSRRAVTGSTLVVFLILAHAARVS
ncbi:MAG: hypothetical protein ACO33A_00495 [Hyphomonas sp.]